MLLYRNVQCVYVLDTTECTYCNLWGNQDFFCMLHALLVAFLAQKVDRVGVNSAGKDESSHDFLKGIETVKPCFESVQTKIYAALLIAH